jgi:effector-binding domain-containing protein
MQYDVSLDQQAVQSLAVVRRRAKPPDVGRVIQECCGLVWNVMRTQKVAGAGRHVSVYFDDVINLEIGVEVPTPFADHGEVVGSALPSGPVARTTHFGPYQLLGDAHDAIHQWCKANGHKLAGPRWEIYGHWLDEWNRDPSKIRTDICYLLR